MRQPTCHVERSEPSLFSSECCSPPRSCSSFTCCFHPYSRYAGFWLPFDLCSQGTHRRGDVDLRRVDRGASDESIGAGRDHHAGVANLDAAVNLETAGWVGRIEQFPHAPDTPKRGRDKGLAAKSRV